jgi:lysophospholipase L1-like esterase
MTTNNITSQQNWFEVNPKKTIATIIIIGFLIFDFSLAAALKIVGLFEPSYVTSSVRKTYYRKAHPVYHHDLSKNINNYTDKWGKGDYQINTNSLGFKDSSNRNIALAVKNKRMLLIGDSFTEGLGVKFGETFAGLLKKDLALENIDVLNAAVTSYSPIIYYRKIKYLIEKVGLKFDLVVVLVDLSDVEDEALGYKFDNNENVIYQGSGFNFGAAESKEKPDMNVKEFFTQYTYFLGRLRNLSAALRAKPLSWEHALNKRRAMWTLDDTLYNEFGEKGLTIAATHMTQLKSYLDKKNIPLTIAVYPWPDQILNNDSESKQVVFWENWSAQNKVKFINLFKVFIPSSNPEDTIQKYHINGDVHWNTAGHKAIYEALRPQITARLLPLP